MKMAKCKFCEKELGTEDKFGFKKIGYCRLSCWLLDLDYRLMKIEKKVENSWKPLKISQK